MKVYDLPIQDLSLFRQHIRVNITIPLELIKSIQSQGILKPLIITEECKILDGTRRWLAAIILNLTMIPCYIISREDEINTLRLIHDNLFERKDNA